MGRRRTNPKYLRMIRQKSMAAPAMMSLFHGNPEGRHGKIITDDGRIVDLALQPDPVSRTRAKALNLSQLWQSDFHQNVNPVCFIKVVGPHYPYGLKRSFSGQKHFFVEETFEFIRTSIVYSSKDIAMMAFNAGRITWIERISRTPVPPRPPVDPG